MTLLLTLEEMAEVDCSTSEVEFPLAIARRQLKKDLAELKRIRDDNINIIDGFLSVDLHNLIIRMEVEVEE